MFLKSANKTHADLRIIHNGVPADRGKYKILPCVYTNARRQNAHLSQWRDYCGRPSRDPEYNKRRPSTSVDMEQDSN